MQPVVRPAATGPRFLRRVEDRDRALSPSMPRTRLPDKQLDAEVFGAMEHGGRHGVDGDYSTPRPAARQTGAPACCRTSSCGRPSIAGRSFRPFVVGRRTLDPADRAVRRWRPSTRPSHRTASRHRYALLTRRPPAHLQLRPSHKRRRRRQPSAHPQPAFDPGHSSLRRPPYEDLRAGGLER